MKQRLFLFLFAIFLLITFPISAQNSFSAMQIEIEISREAIPRAEAFFDVPEPSFDGLISDKKVIETVYKEATWIYSGMIWGFDFVYTPSDRARNIKEYFEISSRALENKKLKLSVSDIHFDGERLIAVIDCFPDSFQISEIQNWQKGSTKTQFTSSVKKDEPGIGNNKSETETKIASITAASKEALRAWLRTVTHNKPREVRGSFVFSSAPFLYQKENSWTATVRLYAKLEEIIDYGVY